MQEEKLKSWEMTDLFSPYLATNNVEDSRRIVYKEIKMLLKLNYQRIPSGPSYNERMDVIEESKSEINTFNSTHYKTGVRDTFSATADIVS